MFKVIALAVAVAASSTLAGAQGTTTYKSTAKPATQQAKPTTKRHNKVKKAETQEALQKEAKISEADARATALKQVPNGAVKSSELERDHGKLVYSYDITVPGKAGVQEVKVNAIDGSVVAKQHESAKTEKKEAAAKKATK